jgi:hypothetical protein
MPWVNRLIAQQGHTTLWQKYLQDLAAGSLQSTLGEHFGSINACTLRRAHAPQESGIARGKIVLEGFYPVQRHGLMTRFNFLPVELTLYANSNVRS